MSRAKAIAAVTIPELPSTITLTQSQRASLELITKEEARITTEARAALFNLNLQRQLVIREIEEGVKIPEGSLSKYQDAGKELVLAVKE